MDSSEVSEIKRHFGVVAEGLRSDIRQVAEAVAAMQTDLTSFKDEVRQEFEETRAMIRLSYAELDRRIRVLESGHASLEARVQRLEAR